jgi:hypothetical protein
MQSISNLSFIHTFCKAFYAYHSNSCISTPIENWTHVYMNLFTRNSPYYHLLKYLLFSLKHPVYLAVLLKRNRLIRHHLFFLRIAVKKKRFLNYFRKQDKRLRIDLLYFPLSKRNFLISTIDWNFDCLCVCLVGEGGIDFGSRINSKNTESCRFKRRARIDELKSTCLETIKQGYVWRHKETRNDSKFCVWTDN